MKSARPFGGSNGSYIMKMKVCGRIFMLGYRLTIHSHYCNITAPRVNILVECFVVSAMRKKKSGQIKLAQSGGMSPK